MEFKGYLTYEEYKALGGTLDLTPFNLLEFESRRKIDVRTQNRLKNSKEIPNEVKICDYQLIERANQYLKTTADIGSNNIASVSTDGYSESYITADKVAEIMRQKDSEMNNIIREYLLEVNFNGQHLLYAGVK